MASPVIEFREVGLEFGGETILTNISFRIFPGDCFVLIGPSGTGKSSLLKLMAGLLEPTSGDVIIEGRSWRAMRGGERARLTRRMGMLFQRNALFDSLNVAENVAFPLREVTRSGEEEIEALVSTYLEAVGLSEARELFPDEISGGMQKRLGIARALALRPEIVFYDDPTAGLDPITSRKIIQLITGLQKEMNTTVVAVTNDMNRADQMATRIAMVVDCQVIDCGTPAETRLMGDPRVQQFVQGSLVGPLTVLT